MQHCLAFALVLASTAIAAADPRHVTVVDGVTLEPIAHATARIGDRDVAVSERGDVAIEASGPVALAVAAPGYEPSTQTIGDDVSLVLLFTEHALDEVIEVHAQAPRSVTDGSWLLTKDEIQNLPGGGTDALAAVRSLPGVASAPPTAAGRLVIRGGAPADSLLEIDGVPVPFIYHAFDNTTIIPTSMIGAMAYSPGGFGVDEGRATSGMVGITTSDEAPTRPNAQALLSVLDASATGAVPLGHGLSLSGGVRRSTVDLLIPIAVPASVMIGFTTPPRYYDAQLRLDWAAGAHDRLTLLALTSYDRLGVVNNMPDTDLPADFAQDSRFGRAIATWKHEAGRVKNRLVGALGDGDFHAVFDQIQHVDDHTTLALLRDDLSIVAAPWLRVRAGGITEVQQHDLHARSIIIPSDGLPPGHFGDLPIRTIDASYDANYAAAYAAMDLTAGATTLSAGVRADYFAHVRDALVEPRLEVVHKLGALTLRASAGRYARDHDQAEGIPVDLAPEQATQLSTGTELELGGGLAATASVYHTARQALAVSDPTRELPYADTGSGTSNGVDLLLRLHRDDLFGWLGYSFGRTARRDDPMQALHATPFDQTHVLTAIGSYAYGAWRFGARFQYATGLPYTNVVGATYAEDLGRYVPTLAAPYASRYPDTAKLDLKVERMWRTRRVAIAAFVDLANVFRSAQVIRYTYNADFTQRSPLTEYVPLPSIGIRGEM